MNLAPMIDVVFLLLVFFMLASQFGREVAVPLGPPGTGKSYEGPPRHISIAAEHLRLNGVPIAAEDLVKALSPLLAKPTDSVVLQAEITASLQRVLDIATRLTEAGFTSLVIVE